MKKVLFVSVLAVALTFVMTATALADHSPTFYVEWDADTSFTGFDGTTVYGNAGTGSPHQNYLEGTEKCGVCHSVHRAPVAGEKWDTNPADEASRTPVAGGQYNRAEWESSGNTQMLLMNSVADSCDYCHISTSIGGKQLYAGDANWNDNPETNPLASEWDEGYGHHNGCTGCHAVHGANALGIFKGPIATKVLKVQAKGSSLGAQEEVFTIGSTGQAGLAASTIVGMPAWAAAQVPNDAVVDPANVPFFPSYADMVDGTNVRPGTDAYDAQSGAFCTYCHQNYGYASEAIVNPDNDRSLFQGPWYALDTVDGVVDLDGADGDWVSANPNSTTNSAMGMPFKNHPVKSIDGNFAAGGATTAATQVAFAGAETCVSCHDAGASTGAVGVLIQSYPHFTPGYFHFTKSGAYVGDAMDNTPEANGLPAFLASGDAIGLAAAQAWLEDPANYAASSTVQDGQCLKCHVNADESAGVGINF